MGWVHRASLLNSASVTSKGNSVVLDHESLLKDGFSFSLILQGGSKNGRPQSAIKVSQSSWDFAPVSGLQFLINNSPEFLQLNAGRMSRRVKC